jgi:hypothetical protein
MQDWYKREGYQYMMKDKDKRLIWMQKFLYEDKIKKD